MTTPTPQPRSLLALALLAAALGGAGAVAAEVVFTRKLALLFGVTAPAAGTVVAVYMLGMAIGAASGGRLADRLGPRAGRLYVGAELAAGAWALGWPLLFGLAWRWTGAVPLSWTLPACALATLLLVGPAALASGATFPALTRLVGSEGRVHQLYAANAGGAALGALVAGLWLPEWLGLSGTLALAGALSLVAGALMLLPARGGAPPVRSAELPAQLSLRAAAASYGVIGGLGMGVEIGVTRLLQQTGPNPGALCFALVLATYLLGLCLGGTLLEPHLRRLGERRALGAAALLGGLTLALVLGILPFIPEERIIGHMMGPGPGSVALFQLTGLQLSVDRLAIMLAAVLIPGIAAGAGFPIAAAAVSREQRRLSRGELGAGVGLAGATGIGSAVLVSLWMGFLPAIGPGTITLLALLAITALGLAALLLRRPWALALALLSLATLAVPPWAGLQIPPGEEVLVFIETASGPSAVARSSSETSVYTHGERVAGLVLDLDTPMVLHPEPSRVLVIAFGAGVNVAQLVQDPDIERLVCVDIDPALPELAAQLPQVGRELFDGQRAIFVNDDGRHLLRQSPETWDVIYSDVATYAQYVELGTVEFFTLVRSRLDEGGMFALKLHPDTLTREGLRTFLATFQEVFPEAGVFSSRSRLPVLVGFTGPRPDQRQLAARVESAGGLYSAQSATRSPGRVLLGPSALAAIDERPSTDDHPLALRHALMGPLTEETVTKAGAKELGDLYHQLGEDAGQELFGWSGPPERWHPKQPSPMWPRRGWW